MDWEHDYLATYNDKLQRFTEEKERQRDRARALQLCSRCVVRRARPGRAYCQRCTDYAKQYARRKHLRQLYTGFDPFGEKVTRIRDL
jgi:hypothetical protein